MTVWLLSIGQGVTDEHWGEREQLPKFSAGEVEANLSAINPSLEGHGPRGQQGRCGSGRGQGLYGICFSWQERLNRVLLKAP